MALKPCKECGQEISTAATSCPKCGAPTTARYTCRLCTFENDRRDVVVAHVRLKHPSADIRVEDRRGEGARAAGTNLGIAAVLSVVLPGAGQMYRGNLSEGMFWFTLSAVIYVFLGFFGVIPHGLSVLLAALPKRQAMKVATR